MDLITVPIKLIEFLIPLTIAVTALFNIAKSKVILNPVMRRIRYWSALFFGLIHGMGFSFYLKTMLGKASSIVIPLFAFNVGLEVGQIAIVLAVLVLQFLFCKKIGLKRTHWVILTSLIVLALTLPILVDSWVW
jgi:hypothetical protein